MSVRKWPVVGAVMAVLWLFVRGVALEPAAILGEGLIGIGVGLATAHLFRRMYLPRVDLVRSLRVAPRALVYVVLFVYELLTANVDVAYRVLAPSMPIEPDVVQVPLRVETDAAITSIANSITLTPGTLTMDHDADTNTLYVHGIIGRRREEVIAPIRRWEDLLLVIFDEPADPDDEPPVPPASRPPTATSGRSGRGAGRGTEDSDGELSGGDDPGDRPGGDDPSDGTGGPAERGGDDRGD